ncbi:hypothetical protein H3S80_08065 [Bartonella sp. M0177]|uniref:hypothetical protein n=1 Tax=Bartonella sp. M0177 TaxID=2750940 RepID=UPI0018DD9583|nr:hypothetical protein [Bartonella sp. M0177]MBI0004001.1 hypothetical protein [Bartonella sp. M0177]
MIHRKIITILLISILPGCSLGHFNQPPGLIHDLYVKKGADELEVKKAFMECGYPAPYYVTWQEYGLTDNEVIMYTKCMEKSGFKPLEHAASSVVCNTFREKNLPACKPNAVIPSRSVSRRLNSAYCKEWKDEHLPVCQP